MKNLIFITIIFTALTCNTNKEKFSGDTPADKKNIPLQNNTARIQDETPVTFSASDGVKISGVLHYNKNKIDDKEPLILLIHQYKSNKEQWQKSFIDSLISFGYKVLTYDIRNHGESGKSKRDIAEVLTNPDEAPSDLKGIFEWIWSNKGIDTSKIAVIGTSVGASLGLYAKYNFKIKSVIGISGGMHTFEHLTGNYEAAMHKPVLSINNVMFICGKGDNNYADEEKRIMDMFISEPKKLVIFDSDKHGKYLIEEFPEINSVMFDWLKFTLGNN